MAVLNVHERSLACAGHRLGELLDRIVDLDEGLWPSATWPPMRLNGPLGVGARGGHGPIRYEVTQYVRGQWVRFQFAAPTGFHGFHEFEVESLDNERAIVRNTLAMRLTGTARLTWPLVFRPLHDALIEDGLDQAERLATGASTDSRWSPYVHLLRSVIRRLPGSPANSGSARQRKSSQ